MEVAARELSSHYTEIRGRLRRPANAKPDPGICLRPEQTPPPPKKLLIEITPPEPPRPHVCLSDDEYAHSLMAWTWLLRLQDEPPASVPISARNIQAVVAGRYRVNIGDILSNRRTACVVLPRHIAMYLTYTLTGWSYPKIGNSFGHRDHTTAMHAVRRIKDKMAKSEDFSREIHALLRTFGWQP